MTRAPGYTAQSVTKRTRRAAVLVLMLSVLAIVIIGVSACGHDAPTEAPCRIQWQTDTFPSPANPQSIVITRVCK